MGFITKCFIRKNTPELLKKLEKMGYEICPCCDFVISHWLENDIESKTIHGANDDTDNNGGIDCKENENLFLALAAMRDDTDEGQLFLNNLGDWATYYGEGEEGKGLGGFEYYTIPYTLDVTFLRKANTDEIIKHFNNE